MLIDVYDFDGTIYDGDSTADFVLFSLRRHPGVLLGLPRVAAAAPVAAPPPPALEALRLADPDAMTPREALEALYRLKAML